MTGTPDREDLLDVVGTPRIRTAPAGTADLTVAGSGTPDARLRTRPGPPPPDQPADDGGILDGLDLPLDLGV